MLENLFNFMAPQEPNMGQQGGGANLLNFLSDPRQAALLGLAGGLLQASGPSTQRVGMGQALGQGLQGALVGQQGAMRAQAMNQQIKKQQADMERQRQQQARWQAMFQPGPAAPMAPGEQGPPAPGGPAPIESLMPGMAPAARQLFASMPPEQGFPALLARTAPVDKTPQIGAVRKFSKGDSEVSQEWTGKEWRELGSGPRFQEDRSLVQVPDAGSPTGFRYVQRAQALGQPAMGPGGVSLESDGKGGFRFVSGPGAGKGGMTAATQGNLEEKLINSQEALARLSEIQRGFKPEYQQLAPRVGAVINTMKDFVGVPLSPDQAKGLTEFTQYRRDSVANLNRGIKEQTGATMGVQEADRIIAEFPNAGTGVFDGDSPTNFKAKLDGAIKAQRHALYRAAWAKNKGIDPLKTGVELSEVPGLIEKRGAEIERDVRAQNPGITDEAARAQTRALLSAEFGIR